MRNILLLFPLLMLGLSSIAQDSVTVVVNILDDNSKDPIQNVEVLVQKDSTNFRRYTHGKGLIEFQGETQERFVLKLTHARYISITEFITIPKRYEDGDTLFKEIEMRFESMKSQTLSEITIPAPGVPLAVYKSKRLHVEDFEVQNDGNLLLLAYPKRLKKGSELILYDGVQTIKNFQVPGKAKELVRDYRGNPHVVLSLIHI